MHTRIPTNPFLRLALSGDAAFSGASGLVLAIGADPLARLLALPEPLLFGVGLILLPWAALVGWLGSRAELALAAVWTVIGLNALWVVESLLLLPLGWIQPNGLGTAFILAQAAAVALFAERQFMALRRARQGEPAEA